MRPGSRLRKARPDLPNARGARRKTATLPFRTSGSAAGLGLQRKRQGVEEDKGWMWLSITVSPLAGNGKRMF